MKILHIIKSLGRGGAEMLLPETLALHDQEHFEFHYIYFLPWKDQMVSAIESQGGKVSCFKATNNLKILAKRNEVIAYVKRHQIDLIHCHLPWAGFLGRLVFRKTRVPTIYTEHNKQERYHKVTKVLNKATFNWQSKAIAVSADVAGSIQQHIAPKVPVQTLLNGVNTDKFIRNTADNAVRSQLGIPAEAVLVGAVAVFRFQKRLVEWLEVMAEVCETNPYFYGVVVGDGPLKEEIMAAHQRLGLKDRVFFVGLQEEVRPYFNAMDVFMMTSEFEGLPIALLEAMSMQCAVFTTKAGGIKEVVTPQTGMDVDVMDWLQLSQALLANADRGVLSKMGEEARKRVLEQFSLQKMVNELEREYRALANVTF
ncbi:glycosyltransferase [Roseivirga pacifica]|uniref:glycosyltransferase n=1 Tax=Roseivirga pacifica TaxID=1267423 RepID=UPI003BAC0B23